MTESILLNLSFHELCKSLLFTSWTPSVPSFHLTNMIRPCLIFSIRSYTSNVMDWVKPFYPVTDSVSPSFSSHRLSKILFFHHMDSERSCYLSHELSISLLSYHGLGKNLLFISSWHLTTQEDPSFHLTNLVRLSFSSKDSVRPCFSSQRLLRLCFSSRGPVRTLLFNSQTGQGSVFHLSDLAGLYFSSHSFSQTVFFLSQTY